MANETERTDGEEPNEAADLRNFEGGQRALDREDDDSQILVLGPHGETADKCYIEAIDQTVAEANPEYPASDPVADVAYIEPIESAFGIDFEAGDVVQAHEDGDLERARVLSYSFPESRLAAVEEEEENDV